MICFRSRPRRLGARLGPSLTVRVGVRVRFGNSSSNNLYHAFNTPHKEVLIWGAIHLTKISGNFGLKLNGSVRSNRKSFEKTGPPFEVVLFSRSDRSEFWLNGSRPRTLPSNSGTFAQNSWGNIRDYFIGILFELYTIKSFSEGFFFVFVTRSFSRNWFWPL